MAVVFNVAYEAWSDGAASGLGPMGNPLPGGAFDPNADSYGRYGANAGIRRLMGVLADAGVSANIFTSGILAERDPEQVKAVAAAGHEIMGHGYAQNLIPATLSEEDDESSIRRTTELLQDATGKRPTGWVSPRATADGSTMRRLIRHGYKWQADVVDDDLPYLERYEEGDLVAVPLCIDFNDLSHSMRFGRTPRQFVEIFQDTLEQALAASRDTVILDILVHTHCYGRPAGAWAYGALAKMCADRKDIWLTTRGRIAEHFLSEL
ncbi:polysaccharide deacetylase family protein [Enterovirga rhinocerotis]|uniref:polysaccharide deacetylase family protein n=1 Tax=Enterovirga rhinocerotis TaxID=1339210 RepID=UPI001AADDB06|nr:polysaccharide deacetylase family protein [Enterovirga rhinocerotis]